MNKAVFLDRDGTINVDYGYVHKIKDFVFLPRVVDALRLLAKSEYEIVVITSQSGIGRGYYSEQEFLVITEYMKDELTKNGIRVDGVYYCPHDPDGRCECRKPKTKMLEDAVRELQIDLSQSYVIGDKTADIKMGENAGCKTILVKTGKAGKDGAYDVNPDFTAKDLYEAVEWLLKKDNSLNLFKLE